MPIEEFILPTVAKVHETNCSYSSINNLSYLSNKSSTGTEVNSVLWPRETAAKAHKTPSPRPPGTSK